MGSSSGRLSRAELELRVPARPDAPAVARRALERIGGVDRETLEEARLLVSELVANSVKHARLGPDERIEVRVDREGERLRVEVADPGVGFEPRVADPEPERPSRWGLYLVEQLADRWGAETDGASRVWFELRASDRRREEQRAS